MRITRRIFWIFIAMLIAHPMPVITGSLIYVFQNDLGRNFENFLDRNHWYGVTALIAWFLGAMLIYIYEMERIERKLSWTRAVIIGLIPIPFLIYASKDYGIILSATFTWILLPLETIIMGFLIFRKRKSIQVEQPVTSDIDKVIKIARRLLWLLITVVIIFIVFVILRYNVEFEKYTYILVLLAWVFSIMLIYIYQRIKVGKEVDWFVVVIISLIPIPLLILGNPIIHNNTIVFLTIYDYVVFLSWLVLPLVTVMLALLIFRKRRVITEV